MTIRERSVLQSIIIRFCLSPQYLDKNYKSHLLRFIKEKYENKSFKEYGYILEVVELKNILKEEIMSMIPNVFFMIDIVIRVYKPMVGDKLDVVIDKMFPHGIFMMEDKIRILIPINLCPGFQIEKDFSSFYLAELSTKKIYRKGEHLKVELVEVRFEKDGFSCIGSIVT